MKIDLTETKFQLDKLVREAGEVVEKYNSAKWEDDVHDSYSPYISKCKDAELTIRSQKSSLEEVEQQANDVEESSSVMQKLDSIKSQTDAIAV